MSIWINDKTVLKNNLKREKPCHKLGYCPYGSLVEEYPLRAKSTKISCKIFGHDCPMYYQAEELGHFAKRELNNKKEK
jgi:hypothetical protein